MSDAETTATAHGLLGHHGVAARVAELSRARKHLQGVERDLARVERRVSFWDKVVFFSRTPDEAKLKALRAAKEEAAKLCEVARLSWIEAMAPCTTLTPIDVVFRVEQLIDEAVMNRSVGRVAKANERLARGLSEIAERVRSTWLANVDVAGLAARVANDEERWRAGQAEAMAAAHDDALHWAPVDPEMLFVQVAHALEHNRGFHAARATLAREHAETAGLLAQLEHARGLVTWGDRLIPFKQERERAVVELEKHVAVEQEEDRVALDEVRLHLVRAFGAHPMTWLYMSLRAAIVAARSAEAKETAELQGGADVDMVQSGAARAVILATLVELRRALEYAFPGIPPLVFPRGRHRPPSAAEPVKNSPYRMAQPVMHDEIVVDLADEELAFFQHLETRELRGSLAQAVSIASVYGLVSLDLARLDIAWLDRLAVWSDTADEKRESELEARVEAYRRGLAYFGDIALAVVSREAVGHHAMVGLGHALAQSNVAAKHIRTAGGSSSTPRSCPAINKNETISAMNMVRSVMERFFFVHGGRGTWIDDVCRRIWGAQTAIVAPSPEAITRYDEIVDLLAAQLQTQNFVPLVQHVLNLRQHHAEATKNEEEAGARVSFWDKVNFFSDTEDEKLRDEWKAQRKNLGENLAQLEAQVNQMMSAAMAAYPPLGLYEQVWTVIERLGDIHAQSERRTRTHTIRNSKGHVVSRRTETYYVCVIYGVSAARSALEVLTKSMLDAFGPLPTPSDALEAWLQQEL